MNKKVNIYLIRHGETYLNKYKKMQGWADAPLTEKGIKEAHDTGERLCETKFDAVYTSDLSRTINTANIICSHNKYVSDINIQPKKEFRESFFGSLDGSLASEVYEEIAKRKNINVSDVFRTLSLHEISTALKELDTYHEAEEQHEIEERVMKGIHEVIETAEDGSKLMIVTHGNIIRSIVSLIDETIEVKRELKNSGITKIEFIGTIGKVVGFDE